MLKKSAAFFVCVLLLLGSVFTASAKLYFLLDDFKVAKNDDNTFELAGFREEPTEVTVPSELSGYAITTVESRAFAENTTLKKITLPDSMKTIGNGAFSDATALTDVSIGANTVSIGANTFYGCSKLKNIDLGGAITSIPPYSFNRCSAVVRFELPQSVKSIGEYAFFKCSSLEYISIPSSVTEIADNAFDECNRLTIYGDIDSVAHKFAQEHSIPFVSLSGETPTDPTVEERNIGDVDGNGTINEDDSRLLQMFCASLIDRTYIEPAYADVNGDGELNIKDCVGIQKFIANGRF